MWVVRCAEGVVELWLTSEDTGAYGHDIGSNLPELLRRVIAVLPAHAMLRVGMTNPKYILPHLEVYMYYTLLYCAVARFLQFLQLTTLIEYTSHRSKLL